MFRRGELIIIIRSTPPSGMYRIAGDAANEAQLQTQQHMDANTKPPPLDLAGLVASEDETERSDGIGTERKRRDESIEEIDIEVGCAILTDTYRPLRATPMK